ncbi:3-hydroxybutyrate dehydrogenase [Marinobacter lutaoensis]|jgi:3-hydroxybutyrate dehydrogenase|uniref:3-hydroxybutyrate dehydrogenase n=1 Tax=Marinobacter lutaoensis TaxID=135739 RepID=A0A1V2DVA4_9GAMM|nr:3-hydroxybutyrate dehydrogenase [Marinobacter lutaoensis]MBI43944.1 3-hydroxybutyrate dehydrogenase [Oceanospirillales bacterium]NVD34274.1 3-hydroxybutyrate dehydrogenase [Marinobacter lutaoensis]ONF44420.1 3-hydroxybutyrate dehydrogenase [Marinobacter lutaoensis]|tara:strand:+ start:4061 stop:4840 length:780 start_codon:yes stop_codon:yes gene_type:complete
MRLTNRIALITGAGRGIGRAIAEAYGREGAKVAVADLTLDSAGETVAAIEAAGGTALAIAMDVTDEQAVEAGVQQVVATWGGLDIALANAGIQHIEPVHTLDLADWRRVVSVHLDGAFLLTRAALRQMYANGGGTMLYMGSVHSLEASPLKAPYVAAKHGMLGLCRAVAKEGAEHGVRSNIICPGFVRTPLVDKQIPEQARELGISEQDVIRNVMLKNTVDGQFTTLEDVAELAVHLAAFPSAALTGQSFVVSHGWHMQ